MPERVLRQERDEAAASGDHLSSLHHVCHRGGRDSVCCETQWRDQDGSRWHASLVSLLLTHFVWHHFDPNAGLDVRKSGRRGSPQWNVDYPLPSMA